MNWVDEWGLEGENKSSDFIRKTWEKGEDLANRAKRTVIDSPVGQVIGATYDFVDQYFTMREENIIGNDHYNHAMANSRAAQRGTYGATMATVLSNTREFFDYLKGDTLNDITEDQIANRHGRNIPNNVSPEEHNAMFDTRRGGSRVILSNPDEGSRKGK